MKRIDFVCYDFLHSYLVGLLLSAVVVFICWFQTPSVTAAELPDFAMLVEKNRPSIVEIATTRQVRSRAPVADDQIEELLRRINPRERPNLPDEGMPEQRRRAAVGSGFMITEDGFVITNNHVVVGADEIQVTLNDRRVFDAEVIGLDEPSDLALLKIEATNLPHVEFGDSDSLRVGEWVLAIGSPFGLEFSAAAGIVSAKGRSMPGRSSYNYMSFIQTDVAINQGNSGGPLFNLDGEVIGINSQILSSTGGSNGISFSIPSNVATNVIGQLRNTGAVERGLLGVRMREVDYALAEIFGMDRPRGAFVDEVQPDSPADNGGILNEDIILEFNGHDIEYFTDLPFYVGQYRPDTKAEVLIYRNGNQINRTVTLGSSPTNMVADSTPLVSRDRINPLGFRVSELSEEARQVSGLEGVRIAEINAGPGRQAGLREGDLIVSLNRQPIDSTREFARVAEALPEVGFVPIRIVREGQATTLALELVP
ncbi:MAG: Do family serine endopeptidase [Gammaproteobacteria bacterium]|nr:Do family serine endopeptidase [Gammaproteobacteria bacterium]MCY4356503.1 Do family serine endopeptidase [Gammaproteobacteria bacterium]